jgi:outer membrane protein assembly factor BamE (lipoprotein component of BamABCDE complex)
MIGEIKMARKIGLMLVLIAVAAWGCASSQSAPAEKSATGTAAVPDDSPLAKVTIGMDDTEVRKILGEPTTQNAYMTGKAWIPFYYGPDTSRTDYIYKGIGRVVFSRNQYSGQLKVINLLHNPNELAN